MKIVYYKIFLRQISVYINGKLVKTSHSISNYASYIQLMLMTSISCKKLRGVAVEHEYKMDTYTTNILGDAIARFALGWENKSRYI